LIFFQYRELQLAHPQGYLDNLKEAQPVFGEHYFQSLTSIILDDIWSRADPINILNIEYATVEGLSLMRYASAVMKSHLVVPKVLIGRGTCLPFEDKHPKQLSEDFWGTVDAGTLHDLIGDMMFKPLHNTEDNLQK
jgi:hypothetical protein